MSLLSSLVAYYKFDGDVTDASGGGHNGTPIGSPSYVTGKLSQALQFTAGQRVFFGSAVNLGGSFTIACWFNPAVLNTGNSFSILGYGTGGPILQTFSVGKDFSGNPVASFYTDGVGTATSGTITLPLSTWTHLAVTYDGAVASFYVNGALHSTSSISGLLATLLNNVGYSTGVDANGAVDELGAWSRVLNAGEISSLFAGGTGLTYPFVGVLPGAYWKFDGNTVDSAGGNNGTPTAITYATGVKGQAAVFNGSTSIVRVANPANFRSTQWTISAWVKGAPFGAEQSIFESWDQTSGIYSGFQVRVVPSGIQVTLGNLTSFAYIACGLTPIGMLNNDWRHLAASFDGSRVRIYFQGRLVLNQVAAITNVFNTATRVTLGVDEYAPGFFAYWFNGAIDETYYWPRALSDAEILSTFLDPFSVTVIPAPTVLSATPSTGPAGGGTPITITGTGFQSGALVHVGPSLATSVVVVNATTITCNTPAGAGVAPISVTNPDGGVGVLFSGFTYPTAPSGDPVVSIISPAVASAIQPTTPIVIEVTNRPALLLAYYPGLALWEVIHDGTAFAPAYAALSARVAITGGFRYTLLRASGWPASPTITAPPTD